MNSAKKKHLEERVQVAYAAKRSKIRYCRYSSDCDSDMPPNIRKAKNDIKRLEAVVQRWRNAQHRKSEARTNRLEDGRREVKTMILFGTDAQALAAVKKFEALTI